jgi:hypothetical protein
VLVRANFSPDGEDRLLREATKVDKLAVLVDLGKGSTISLSDCDKFSTIGRTKISMALEIVVVDLDMSVSW